MSAFSLCHELPTAILVAIEFVANVNHSETYESSIPNSIHKEVDFEEVIVLLPDIHLTRDSLAFTVRFVICWIKIAIVSVGRCKCEQSKPKDEKSISNEEHRESGDKTPSFRAFLIEFIEIFSSFKQVLLDRWSLS